MKARAAQPTDRPAFYALRGGGWRDLVTLLHPPYTAWHLSYVALGAAAAPRIHADRLGAALGAFPPWRSRCPHGNRAVRFSTTAASTVNPQM